MSSDSSSSGSAEGTSVCSSVGSGVGSSVGSGVGSGVGAVLAPDSDLVSSNYAPYNAHYEGQVIGRSFSGNIEFGSSFFDDTDIADYVAPVTEDEDTEDEIEETEDTEETTAEETEETPEEETEETTAEEEDAPEKDGYIFSGWSEMLDTMPAHDVTITGNFTFVDGIADIRIDEKADGIYTLDGRKIEKLQKGVNIIRNGKEVKKVFVK